MKKKRIVKKKKVVNISPKGIVIILLIILALAVPVIAIIASGAGYDVKQFFTGMAGQIAEGEKDSNKFEIL